MVGRPSILAAVIDRRRGGMSLELAQYVLTLDFPSTLHERYAHLAAKLEEGTLADDERAELEEFLIVNTFLTTIQSKARVALRGPMV
jgi:hypothetical protein